MTYNDHSHLGLKFTWQSTQRSFFSDIRNDWNVANIYEGEYTQRLTVHVKGKEIKLYIVRSACIMCIQFAANSSTVIYEILWFAILKATAILARITGLRLSHGTMEERNTIRYLNVNILIRSIFLHFSLQR